MDDKVCGGVEIVTEIHHAVTLCLLHIPIRIIKEDILRQFHFDRFWFEIN
jgi:hypothetical protein